MTLEEEKSKVYETIGKAISSWGALEMALAVLFSRLLYAQPGHPNAMAVFFSIENFRSKMQTVDGLFQAPWIDRALSKRWAKAQSHIKLRQKKRNRLAHHDIFVREKNKERHRVQVVPPYMSPLNRDKLASGDERPMCLGDLEQTIQEFLAVRMEVLGLGTALEEFQTKQLFERLAASPRKP